MSVAAHTVAMGLPAVMQETAGRPGVVVALLDGPVAWHPDLEQAPIRFLGPSGRQASDSRASTHATFLAGILSARRGSPAPALCPGCTLLVRPVLRDAGQPAAVATATTGDLGDAIIECVEAGALVLNLSVTTAQPSTLGERALEDALTFAAASGCVVVAAGGNQGTLGSSAITRHPWVLPVSACDEGGHPLPATNLGQSLGVRGLSALGVGVVSLSPGSGYVQGGGTSAAAAFVSGAAALLRSIVPAAAASHVRQALTRSSERRTVRSVVPPLLDAELALAELTQRTEAQGGGRE